MKKLALVIGLLFLLLAVAPVVAGNGNDAPTGAHFNLNIIGTKDKNMPSNLDSGKTIFVKFDKSGVKVITNIYLTEGPFQVLDKDGTDGSASFQLPYPYTTLGGPTVCYDIYARALGKPGGYANITTCTYDTSAGETYCNTGNTVKLSRTSGGVAKFTKVTTALTTVNGGPIFAEQYDSYWWEYENNGLKHAQLRFYQLDTCYKNTWI